MEGRGGTTPTSTGLLRLAACALLVSGVLAVDGCRSVQPNGSRARSGEAEAGTTLGVGSDGVRRTVLLRFDGAERGEVLESFRSSGLAPVRVELVTQGSGGVRGAVSPHGRAARFPTYAQGDRNFAVLSVVNEGNGEMLGPAEDVLSPAEGAFAFGADVALDRVSSGSPADDGDNVVQRGGFRSPSQYKLQVDGRRPSCLVRGLAGAVMVVAEVRMAPGAWYRLRCSRRLDTLRLRVARLGEDGPIEWSESTGSGPIGPVVMPSSTPLSVAGKLADERTVVSGSSDQLNGRLDRVFYRAVG